MSDADVFLNGGKLQLETYPIDGIPKKRYTNLSKHYNYKIENFLRIMRNGKVISEASTTLPHPFDFNFYDIVISVLIPIYLILISGFQFLDFNFLILIS